MEGRRKGHQENLTRRRKRRKSVSLGGDDAVFILILRSYVFIPDPNRAGKLYQCAENSLLSRLLFFCRDVWLNSFSFWTFLVFVRRQEEKVATTWLEVSSPNLAEGVGALCDITIIICEVHQHVR